MAATELSLRTLSALGVLIASATVSLAVDADSRTLTVLDGLKPADEANVCSLTGDKDEAGDAGGPDVGEKLAAPLPLELLVSTRNVPAAVLPELSANKDFADEASVDALGAFVTSVAMLEVDTARPDVDETELLMTPVVVLGLLSVTALVPLTLGVVADGLTLVDGFDLRAHNTASKYCGEHR